MRKNTNFITILFLFFLGVPSLLFGASRIVYSVESGHQGSISAMASHPERPYLFTGDEDGVLCVWNSETGELLDHFQVGRYALRKIIVNPRFNQIALYETDDLQRHRLSLWDWDQNEKLHSFSINEKPLYMDYSGRGRYFFFGRTDLPSFQIFNSSSGVSLPYLRSLFSLGSFAYIGSSESLLMLYSTNGKISYLDLTSGEEKHTLSTEQNLKNLSVSQDKRYLIGRREDTLFAIDRLKGNVTSRLRIPNLKMVTYDPSTDSLYTLSEINRRGAVSRLSFQEGTIDEESVITYRSSAAGTQQITATEKALFVGDDQGNIFEWRPPKRAAKDESEDEDTSVMATAADEEWLFFSLNLIQPLSGAAVLDDTLFAASSAWIYRFQSPYFADLPESPRALEELNFQQIPNPWKEPLEMAALENQKLLFWSTGSYGANRIGLWDPQEQSFINEIDLGNSTLREVKVDREFNRVLILTRDGNINVYSSLDLSLSFSTAFRGAKSAVLWGENTIIIGASSTRGTPLKTINMKTGESLPLEDSCFVAYGLTADWENRYLYYIGMEERNDNVVTLMKRLSGTALNRNRSLLRHSAEDTLAQTAVDTGSGRVYTNLGQDRIRAWLGSRFKNFSPSKRYPLSLYPLSSRILSLNEDDSLNLWDALSGDLLLKLFIFKDGSWAFLPRNYPRFFGKPDSLPHISMERNGREYTGRLNGYLEVPENYTPREEADEEKSDSDEADPSGTNPGEDD